MTFNVLSLFSGIGGLRPLDLGLERAGMTVVGQVEIDPWCQRVLAKHWPEVPRHDDVRTAARWWLTEPRPAVDLICGGFPCQPVSVAGKRLAQADERWLWPAFADTIRQLRPAYALMENVPGLLAAGMGDVLGDLAACGYDAEWDCVSASAVGAPHRRDRVWIVAYTAGQGSPDGRAAPGRRSGTARWLESERLGCDVADAGGPGLAQRESQRGHDGAELAAAQRSRHGTRDMANAASHLRRAPRYDRPAAPDWRRPGRRDHWAAEPDVGRVAHGIPARVDRLRGLGNAVVPQVAEHIGRLIMRGAESPPAGPGHGGIPGSGAQGRDGDRGAAGNRLSGSLRSAAGG